MSKILTEKNRRSVGRYILSGLLMIVFLAGLGATSASATTVILPTVQVVTFYENASAGDPVVTFESSDTAQNLTMENSLNPAFVNSGSTFVGWNTSPDGTGTPFADGAPYTFAIDLPLFAQWAVLPVVHTVTFYQNDNSLDHVVAFVNGTIPGSLTQFGSLNPTFVKADSSFVDWNTAANGTGMAYANGASFSFSFDLSVYAQWQAIPPAIASFAANGGTGTIASLSSQMGSSVTLPSGTGVSRPGYAFAGWNTSASGGGVSYLAGATFVLSSSSTLYAQWTPDVYVVNYSVNGGTIAQSTTDFIYGSAPLVLATPTLAGNQFDGWFSAATGGTLVGAGAAAFTPSASTTLYAQWTKVLTFTLSFSANGGSGSIASIVGVAGSSVSIPGAAGMLRSGYRLARWSTGPKGTGTSFLPGQQMNLTRSAKLFAQWSGHAPASLYGAVGVFSNRSSKLTPSLKAEVNRLASRIKAKKYSLITLYGYTANTGLATLNISLSRGRAIRVETYLRSRLNSMHLKHVRIKASGEGAVSGERGPNYSRVEVFVN